MVFSLFILCDPPIKNDFLQVWGIVELLRFLIFHCQAHNTSVVFLLFGYYFNQLYELFAQADSTMCTMLQENMSTDKFACSVYRVGDFCSLILLYSRC